MSGVREGGLTTGTRYGFRGWRVDQTGPDPGGVRLVGARSGGWRPGTNTAVCRRLAGEGPRAGGNLTADQGAIHDLAECTCGCYASRFPVLPAFFYARRHAVLGVVAGWDEVVEGRRGWRSRSAEIVALVRPPVRRWWDLPRRLVVTAVYALPVAFVPAGFFALLRAMDLTWQIVPLAILGFLPWLGAALTYLFNCRVPLAYRHPPRGWPRSTAESRLLAPGHTRGTHADAVHAFELARIAFPDAVVFDTPRIALHWVRTRERQARGQRREQRR